MTVTDEMVERALDAYEAKLLELHSDKYKAAEPISVSEIRAGCLRAALTAALSDQVVVPKEAADAQIISALEWSLEWMRKHNVDGLSPFKDYPPVKDTIKGMYAAMIAAAPPPSSTARERPR